VEIKDKSAQLRQIPEITGGIVVMEANTGKVLAIAGGWSATSNPFNCATQAIRQPGSCFKPFVYLSALEQGIEPNNIIEDQQIVMWLNNGREIYTPKNFDGRIHGTTSVKNSLANSYNLASLQLALNTGIEHIQDIGELFGIYEHTPSHPSVILGASETSLLKLTTAYSMIFNGGYHIKPRFFNAYTQRQLSHINKNTRLCGIECHNNLASVSLTTLTSRQRLATPQAIFGLIEMLRAVITRGTGKSLLPLEKKLGVTFRGKTGTTNNNHDAWFVGSVSIPGTIYQDNNPLVIGVFVGFLKAKNLGKGNGGAIMAMPIFGNFIKNILSDTLTAIENL
jgi:penicillin-binding protein 1A